MILRGHALEFAYSSLVLLDFWRDNHNHSSQRVRFVDCRLVVQHCDLPSVYLPNVFVEYGPLDGCFWFDQPASDSMDAVFLAQAFLRHEISM